MRNFGRQWANGFLPLLAIPVLSRSNIPHFSARQESWATKNRTIIPKQEVKLAHWHQISNGPWNEKTKNYCFEWKTKERNKIPHTPPCHGQFLCLLAALLSAIGHVAFCCENASQILNGYESFPLGWDTGKWIAAGAVAIQSMYKPKHMCIPFLWSLAKYGVLY